MTLVALNSGGFDSVVMLHVLRERYPEDTIHTIFFDYGQRALQYEQECSKKTAEKLNMKWECIKLNIPWLDCCDLKSKGETSSNGDSLYLPFRNLIMLSYAVSYAQVVNSPKVFTAFILPAENSYPDVRPEFVDSVNFITEKSGIEIVTPLIQKSKWELLSYARKYKIRKEDFNSCFHLTNKDGVCECPNCKFFKENSEYFSDEYKLEDSYSLEDISVISYTRKQGVIQSAKLSVNNFCNLRCPYCFMNDVEHCGVTLSIEKWKEVIKKLYSFGIKHFDLFGKEPLFNGDVFDIMKVKEEENLDIHFTMISNGKNAEKYIYDILESPLESISFSYDGGFLRKYTISDEVISNLISVGMPVNISIDVHKDNYMLISQFLRHFFDLGVQSVYVKPIINVGGSTDKYSVSEFDYGNLITEIVESNPLMPETTFYIPHQFGKLSHSYFKEFQYKIPEFNNGIVRISNDFVCSSGYSSVFINADGKVYGCGEVAYNGNNSVKSILDIKTYQELKNEITNFCGRNCCNPLDKLASIG